MKATDNWVTVMWDLYGRSGNLSLGIFPLMIILGNFITLNIFLAILLSTFSAAAKAEGAAAEAAAEQEGKAVQRAAKAAAAVTANADLIKAGQHRRQGRSKTLSIQRAAAAGARQNRSRSASPDFQQGHSPSHTSIGVTYAGVREPGWREWDKVGSRASNVSTSTVPAKSQAKKLGWNASEPSRAGAMLQQQKGFTGRSAEGELEVHAPTLNAISVLGASNETLSPGTKLAAAAAAALGPDATLRATKVFMKHDADDSGTIDQQELSSALRELGLEDDVEHVREVMAKYDFDGNQALDLAEFLMLVRDTPAAPPTDLGRFLHSNLPMSIRNSAFMRAWVVGAARRHAASLRVKAATRSKQERLIRKLRRSEFRGRHGEPAGIEDRSLTF